MIDTDTIREMNVMHDNLHVVNVLCDELDAEREKVRVAVEALEIAIEEISALHEVTDVADDECEEMAEIKQALTRLKPEGEQEEDK